MKLELGKVRLRLAWLLVPPYYYWARPTLPLLLTGLALAVGGAALRAWAAGVIRKGQVLAVSGPYAYTRNPLYLGSFLIGLGLAVASGRAALVAVFLPLFAIVYGRTMREERRTLEEKFGDEYRAYAGSVPAFLPRLRPHRPAAAETGGAVPRFELERYLGHREHHTALGILLGFLVLVALFLGTS